MRVEQYMRDYKHAEALVDRKDGIIGYVRIEQLAAAFYKIREIKADIAALRACLHDILDVRPRPSVEVEKIIHAALESTKAHETLEA